MDQETFARVMGLQAALERFRELKLAHAVEMGVLDDKIDEAESALGGFAEQAEAIRQGKARKQEEEFNAALVEAGALVEPGHTREQYLAALAKVRVNEHIQRHHLTIHRDRVRRLEAALWQSQRNTRRIQDALDGKHGIPL